LNDAKYFKEKEKLRCYFLKYTERAYKTLPALEKPRILDIGCGSGSSTIKLAQLSKGDITGIDIDRGALNILHRKIENKGLSGRIRTLECSMSAMKFPREHFDIIWAEGVIGFIGFSQALKSWRRFIKKNGFLVIHDSNQNMQNNLHLIAGLGYNLLGHFAYSGRVWLDEYYLPLEKSIITLRHEKGVPPEMEKIIIKDQNEIDTVKRSPDSCGAVFYIMQKCPLTAEWRRQNPKS